MPVSLLLVAGLLFPALAAPAVFEPATVPSSPMVNDPAGVSLVAADTLRYIDQYLAADFAPGAVLPGVTPESARTTLRRVAAAGARLADPTYLSACFSALRWRPDSEKWGGKIRLTRYLVYEAAGDELPTSEHRFALYAAPNDEAGLSPGDVTARRDSLDRFKYTRQDVAAGVYRAGGAAIGRANPLVWLTHDDHEQAILQGTVSVHTPSGSRLFNVDRDNGIPYDRSITDTKQQRRYWYFRETDAVRGAGNPDTTKVALQPGAAVAGDLENVGLGTLVALQAADGLHLVVVADTGGAFQPNLHQLDLYTGVFPSRAAFDAATIKVGDTATAYVLVARSGVAGCDKPAP